MSLLLSLLGFEEVVYFLLYRLPSIIGVDPIGKAIVSYDNLRYSVAFLETLFVLYDLAVQIELVNVALDLLRHPTTRHN